jgi:hypothetical protein
MYYDRHSHEFRDAVSDHHVVVIISISKLAYFPMIAIKWTPSFIRKMSQR